MKSSNNIYDLTGFSKVYRFTIEQTFKSPTYRTALIMFIVMAFLMGPLTMLGGMAGMNAAKDSDVMAGSDKVPATTMYVVNSSFVDFPEELMNLEDTSFSDMKIQEADTLPKLGATEIGLIVSRKNVDGEDSYLLETVISDDSELTAHEVEELSDYLIGGFNDARLKSADVSPAQTELLGSGLTTGGVQSETEYYEAKEKKFSSRQVSSFATIYCIAVFILATLAASYVVNTVMEEKVSKLVENLLVSVRPMALLMGKILAIMSYVGILLVGAGAAAFISNKVTGLFIPEEMKEVTSELNFASLTEMGIWRIAVILLCLVVSFFLMSVLAGILGSACTKLEDSQSAVGTITIFSMVGYLVGMIIPGMENKTVDIIASIVPVTSPFIAPVYAVTGRIPIWVFVLGMLILISMTFLLLMLGAKVYKKLIVNDSKKLGFLEIIKLSREGA
ncbi:MAG: ABC transporter permease [Lachnospiraceae bacterium]|nr:ABC transporter permease [Lachnospiraceae bacterium]